jgi:hypothetical protein
MWIIDSLVTHPSPHLGVLAHLSTLEVLQAKEGTQTPYPFIVFTFGFAIESIKELGGASDKLAQDPYDVVVWHLFLLLSQWCLVLPPRGGAVKYRETWIWFKYFLVGHWENLQKEFFL